MVVSGCVRVDQSGADSGLWSPDIWQAPDPLTSLRFEDGENSLPGQRVSVWAGNDDLRRIRHYEVDHGLVLLGHRDILAGTDRLHPGNTQLRFYPIGYPGSQWSLSVFAASYTASWHRDVDRRRNCYDVVGDPAGLRYSTHPVPAVPHCTGAVLPGYIRRILQGIHAEDTEVLLVNTGIVKKCSAKEKGDLVENYHFIRACSSIFTSHFDGCDIELRGSRFQDRYRRYVRFCFNMASSFRFW